MRSNVENSRARGIINETAELFIGDVLAISANQTLVAGMPRMLAFDPASTGRNIVLYTPSTPSLWHKHEIWNISTGTGILTLQQTDAATTVGTIAPGQSAEVYWNPKTQTWQSFNRTNGVTQTVGSQQTIQQYTKLADLVNTNVLAMALPFAFTLNSVGFRVRTPAVTAAKAATLTAQVNGVSVTGGVVSLTSANATPTNTLVAGTSITAGNTGTAGHTIGVVVSGVTAFAEGDGYVEYNVTNKNLTA